MTPFELVAALMTVVALAGWLNVKTLHVPNGVAMLIAGFAGAGLLFALQRLFPQFEGWKEDLGLHQPNRFRLDGDRLHAGVPALRRRDAGRPGGDAKALAVGQRARHASVSQPRSCIVGTGLWLIAGGLGLPLPLAWALVFGALISPTDPVAVLATVRQVKFSTSLAGDPAGRGALQRRRRHRRFHRAARAGDGRGRHQSGTRRHRRRRPGAGRPVPRHGGKLARDPPHGDARRFRRRGRNVDRAGDGNLRGGAGDASERRDCRGRRRHAVRRRARQGGDAGTRPRPTSSGSGLWWTRYSTRCCFSCSASR